MPDADVLRAQLADDLARDFGIGATWHAAFAAVGRHVFLRRFFRHTEDRLTYIPVSDGDPGWLEMVYSNATWPTQIDGDDSLWDTARDSGEPVQGSPTCSSSQPSLMAVMLEALDVRDGDSVLEIGTGTGYNSALLCQRLGPALVSTVEVDARLANRAKQDLAESGYPPGIVAVNDGASGLRVNAPYDRIIATCSVPTIPDEWRWQTRPGGIILASLYRQLAGGALVRLTVAEDGSAIGTLVNDDGVFMPLRATAQADALALVRRAVRQDTETITEARIPEPLLQDSAAPWVALAGLLLPDAALVEIGNGQDSDTVQWLVHSDGSWACCDTSSRQVEQGGQRRLWDDFERLYALWVEHDKPGRDRIGLHVSKHGEHRVWINDANTADPRLLITAQ